MNLSGFGWIPTSKNGRQCEKNGAPQELWEASSVKQTKQMLLLLSIIKQTKQIKLYLYLFLFLYLYL